jgi:hypothetical protein
MKKHIALALVALQVATLSAAPASAQEWSGKGRLACKAWSGIVRQIALSSEKGYPPKAAMKAIEGSKGVDERLHSALSDTVKGIYGGNLGIQNLAIGGGWADACSDYFLPKELSW